MRDGGTEEERDMGRELRGHGKISFKDTHPVTYLLHPGPTYHSYTISQ